MDDDQDRGADHKRPDNDGDSLHRPACKPTSDDAATVIGVCVSLLAMLVGALVCIASFGLLMVVLLHIGLHLQTS
jgi:hypothetical protein